VFKYPRCKHIPACNHPRVKAQVFKTKPTMICPTTQRSQGFSLIELLVVILIISMLLTLGAVGMKGMTGGKGISSAVATTEALFDEARSIAVGKGTRARVLVDINDIQNTENYL